MLLHFILVLFLSLVLLKLLKALPWIFIQAISNMLRSLGWLGQKQQTQWLEPRQEWHWQQGTALSSGSSWGGWTFHARGSVLYALCQQACSKGVQRLVRPFWMLKKVSIQRAHLPHRLGAGKDFLRWMPLAAGIWLFKNLLAWKCGFSKEVHKSWKIPRILVGS